MKFSSYSINKELLEALNSLGYEEATLIQEKTLVKALRGNSLIAKSETGSGKTHAYLIPLLNNLNLSLNKVQGIILEPTYELCIQCAKFANDIAAITKNFRVISVDSNSMKVDSINLLNPDRPAILVATPMKVAEIIANAGLDLKYVKTLILDEVDMLLEGEESQKVISLIDRIHAPQRLVFTATMKEHQIASIKKLFEISEVIDVNKNYSSNNVSHHFVDIKHRPLAEAVTTFIKAEQPYFTLVFASNKKTITSLYYQLNKQGIKCALLTSDINVRERKNLIKRITDGEFSLVLCSDLASRGLDFDRVSHVISLDIPANIDYYYHRAGRTGRYNNKGDSYIFYDDELNKKSKETLQKKLKFDFLILRQEGLKVDRKHAPTPKKKNDALEAEIKKEISKVRSSKVKPGYKKKIKRAVEKAKKNHKRKIIMTNLKSKRKMMASVDD